jgi:hypothetical protein
VGLLGKAREDRARLAGVVANGHDEIEGYVDDFVHVFGTLRGQIHTHFLHYAHGKGIQAVSLDTRRIGFEDIAPEQSSPTFRHLAAARVPRAEKQHLPA